MGQASIELTHGVRRPAALRLLSDDRLARRAAEGDRGAFAVIFERHHQGLYRYCRAILRHDEDACDALQSTFTRAIAALDGDARSVAIRPWLYRIAHNESISMLRRRRPVDALGSQPDPGSATPGPHDRVLSSERMRQLLADLEQLPERQRWALLLRELNDLSYADIAAAITTTEQAARQSVYEARVMLMELKEGREMPCADVRQLISERDGRLLRPRKVRAHLRACEPCTEFRAAIGARRADLAALAPPLPAAAAAAVLSALLGGGGGGGLGGGGLLTALAAGKGLVAGAGSKGLATAAALTIAGGTLVTTGGTLPQLGRDEHAKRPPALKAPGTLRTSATTPGSGVLAFLGHYDAPAPEVPQARPHEPAATAPALGEQAPHDPSPVSPAPAPAPVTPLGDDRGQDEHAPVAHDGAPSGADHGAAGSPRVQQHTDTSAGGSSAEDQDGSAHADEARDDAVRGSGRREGRDTDEQADGPPAHASSSAHAERPGDGGSARQSHVDSGRGNDAAESSRRDGEARGRGRGASEANDSARGHDAREQSENEGETRGHGDRGRDENTPGANGRNDPPGHDDRPSRDQDTPGANGRNDPPGHDDRPSRSDPPSHDGRGTDDDASRGDSRNDPPSRDTTTGNRNDPPSREQSTARPESGPAAAERGPAGGGSSKSPKPAR